MCNDTNCIKKTMELSCVKHQWFNCMGKTFNKWFMIPNLKLELKEEITKVKNSKDLTPFQKAYFLWDLKRDYDNSTN